MGEKDWLAYHDLLPRALDKADWQSELYNTLQDTAPASIRTRGEIPR